MSSLNKVILIGRVGKDPEIRNAGNGKPIASFSIATSETWKDKQGQKQEKTEWHNVTCFNESLCRVIENYVKKGSHIYIEGKLVTEKYTDKNGVEKYTTKIVLQNFDGKLVLLGGKSDNTQPDDSGQYRPLDKAVGNYSADDLEDSIPF